MSSTKTVVFDAATNAPWATAAAGESAYDTATVTGVRGVTPLGSVTYRFFTTGDCAGAPGRWARCTCRAGRCPTPNRQRR